MLRVKEAYNSEEKTELDYIGIDSRLRAQKARFSLITTVGTILLPKFSLVHIIFIFVIFTGTLTSNARMFR